MAKTKEKRPRDSEAPQPPPPPLRLEWIQAGTLTENPRNWRTHPDKQMRALKSVIGDPEIGWAGACLFNERTGRLIDGHARRNSVDAQTPIPVLVGSWSEEAEKKILLTLDPLAALANADLTQLDSLMSETSLGGDLSAVGEQLGKMVGNLPDEMSLDRQEEDDVPIKKLDFRPPPQMAWVLIGIPLVRYGEISADMERIGEIRGVLLETTLSDANADENGQR